MSVKPVFIVPLTDTNGKVENGTIPKVSSSTTINTTATTTQARMKKKQSHKEKEHHITYYELLELEKQKNEQNTAVKIKIKRNFPIAPDGFIPNSVVKKFFRLFDPNQKQPEKKIWKLKWRPPEKVIEENDIVDESGEYNPQSFYLDLSEEENEEEENESGTADVANDLNDPDVYLKELIKRLKSYEWFKTKEDLNVESIIRILVNKLIERDPSNHEIIVNMLIDIKKRFKVNPGLVDWIVSQLEEELDGTNSNIILNNVKLLTLLGQESYNIDCSLLNLLSQTSQPVLLKEAVRDYFLNVIELDEKQLDVALQNLKRLLSPKYKKIVDFKLKRFVQEVETEIETANARKNLNTDEETNSETFKQILKEDWIADNVKENLKTLRDFMTYLIKSLKTVKSKMFYEKLCFYVNNLFNEFKLMNTNWEKELVDHFINTNQDSKVVEPLRVCDIDNMPKYFPTTSDNSIKSDILVELLRSAAQEKNRPQVAENAKQQLKKLSNLIDYDVDGIVEFYRSKNINNKILKLNWGELWNLYKTKPNISEIELYELKGLSPEVVAQSIVTPSDIDSAMSEMMSGSTGTKVSKKKATTGGKKQKVTIEQKSSKESKKVVSDKSEKVKKEKIDVIPENVNSIIEEKSTTDKSEKALNTNLNKSESAEKSTEKTEKIEKSDKDKQAADKALKSDKVTPRVEKTLAKTEKRGDNRKDRINETTIETLRSDRPKRPLESQKGPDKSKLTVGTSQSRNKTHLPENHPTDEEETVIEISRPKTPMKSNLLPNTQKGWDYYEKRNKREKNQKDNDNRPVTDVDQTLEVNLEITDAEPEENEFVDEYEKEYRMLKKRQEEDENEQVNEQKQPTTKQTAEWDIKKDEIFGESGDEGQWSDEEVEYTLPNMDSLSYRDNLTDGRQRTTLNERVRVSSSVDGRTSKELLRGITRRVITNQTPFSKKISSFNDVFMRLNTFMSGNPVEKGHFIPPLMLNETRTPRNRDELVNLKMIMYGQNKRRREIEYNKLLECLIIRHLELHQHYEKLLPSSNLFRTHETFVPVPFFKDFLVVHPYNTRASIYIHPQQQAIEDAPEPTVTAVPGLGKTNEFRPFLVEAETLKIDYLSNHNSFQGIKRKTKRNERFYRNVTEPAKVADFDLNHIYLINKLLISYGAENIREFYASLNNDFRNYLRRLHTRIPHKIIPLIWNDPVIQKLALILSSSYKLKTKPSKDKKTPHLKKSFVLPKISKTYRNEEPFSVTNSLHTKPLRRPTVDVQNENLQTDTNKNKENFPNVGKSHPLNMLNNRNNKYPYNMWPVFKQEDTPRNRVVKKKLYYHLMNVKHDYVKLQWKHMLQQEEKSKENKSQVSYLPSLSLKANLNAHEE